MLSYILAMLRSKISERLFRLVTLNHHTAEYDRLDHLQLLDILQFILLQHIKFMGLNHK